MPHIRLMVLGHFVLALCGNEIVARIPVRQMDAETLAAIEEGF